MRSPSGVHIILAAALCCAPGLTGAQGYAADFDRCSTGDEPNVICAYGVGNWGCNGPCEGGGKYGPVTIYTPPADYQVCKPLMTRRDIQGGECHFAGGPSELQLACTAPGPTTRARVQEITVYSISRKAGLEQYARKYECIRW